MREHVTKRSEHRTGEAVAVRRAHMVSKGYLRAWADAGNRVAVIDRQYGRGFTASVESATVVSYVYDPEVLSVDLEAHFARTESTGISALNVLRTQELLTKETQYSVVEFLDMHLERGRYADQAAITNSAVVVRRSGETEVLSLKLGDRLLLSRNMEGFSRLGDLAIEHWPWQIYTTDMLVTGDGAVLLLREAKGGDICTVTFPVSPTQLLVIGQDIEADLAVNQLVMQNCRRWIVGTVGTLTQDPKRIEAARTGVPLSDAT